MFPTRPHVCAKCGTPVDGPYCRGCALLLKNFKEDLLTYYGENEISKDFEDISGSSDDNTNVVNAPREPFVVNQDPGEKSSQGPPQIDQNIMNDLGYKRFRGEKIDEEYEKDCEIRIRKLKQDSNEWGSKGGGFFPKKEQAYNEEQYSAARRRMLSIPFVDEDDYIPLGDIIARYSTSKAITPALSPEEPVDSLIMEDEHLDTIPETESDEFIKSSVENLVQNPSESADVSDGESECDVPIDDDSPESHFTTFSNPLFDSNDDFSSDDESLSEEEIQKDEFKYFSNPLYDLDNEIITNEKILPNQKDLDEIIPIPPGMDEPCFNAESYILESLLNRDSPIDSTKINSIFNEFSLPRPPKESNSECFNAIIESLFPFPISIKDSDPFMEEIDLFLASDDLTPPGVESDDDSEGDILPLEELLDNVLPKSDAFTVDDEPVATVTNDFDNNTPFDPGEEPNKMLLASGTDKSKITKNQSKTGKHGHGNQKSTKRSQRIKAVAREVKPYKKRHSPSLIGPIPKEECHVVERKAQVKKKIALVSLTKLTQTSHHGMTAWQSSGVHNMIQRLKTNIQSLKELMAEIKRSRQQGKGPRSFSTAL
ncbi:hypothetical protein Tco_0715231 [Tanacetum coccineum]